MSRGGECGAVKRRNVARIMRGGHKPSIIQSESVKLKTKIKMKKNGCKDFFEAIGFENPDDVKMMLEQIGIGMVLGLALIAVLGLGELFS